MHNGIRLRLDELESPRRYREPWQEKAHGHCSRVILQIFTSKRCITTLFTSNPNNCAADRTQPSGSHEVSVYTEPLSEARRGVGEYHAA